MKKQGFTLIELMVVVVIIGILAAVAVPKLFGMIAKSKASEVGPAAGEYVKLQDAFVSERGTRVGNWYEIGYVMQNSSNFKYCATGATCGADANEDGYAGSKGKTGDSTWVAHWTATNIATLNDCQADSYWDLVTAQNADIGGVVSYDAKISNDANCKTLTPNFEKMTSALSTSTGGN